MTGIDIGIGQKIHKEWRVAVSETRVSKIEDSLAKNWTETRVLRETVKGNGSEGHEQRILKNEVRITTVERTFQDYLQTGRAKTCMGVKAVEQWKAEQKDRRTWRIGDVANIIQLIMLGLLLWQIFFK